jgi:prolipoprotein diacylglyceryltransferase
MEFTLLAAAVTAVAAMWLTLRLTGHAGCFDLLVTAAVVGLFTGRLVAMVLAGVNPITRPLDILIVRGGVDTVGAAVGAIVYLAWITRDRREILDAVAPAAVAGMAGWHAGCLWRGTCLGAAADIPWGWTLSGSDIVRHPVELYAAGLLVVGAWALTRIPAGNGRRALLAFAAVAGARLVTQPLRPSLSGETAWWYGAAVVLGVTGAILVGRSRSTPTSPPS